MVKSFRSCAMNDNARTPLDDLEALAASITDPAKRAGVRKIIARLSDQDGAWPDDAELMRLECHGGSK